MNGLAMIDADTALQIARDRSARLRRRAELERVARPRPRFRWLREMAASVSSLPQALTVIDGDRLVTPQLNDYPYRS